MSVVFGRGKGYLKRMRRFLGLSIVSTAFLLLFSVAAMPGAREDTIRWLVSQGLDHGTATLLADNKAALRQFLLNRGLAKQDDQYCRSLGAAPGTDAYVNCRVALTTNRPVAAPPPQHRPTYVPPNPSEPHELQPWPSIQQHDRGQQAPPLRDVGRGAYCARVPWNC